jgi:hypothetical protein
VSRSEWNIDDCRSRPVGLRPVMTPFSLLFDGCRQEYYCLCNEPGNATTFCVLKPGRTMSGVWWR